MPERFRQSLDGELSPELIAARRAEGWRLAAVEWVRTPETVAAGGRLREEVPYGMQVSADCLYLEENPSEIETLTLILETVVADRPLSEAAAVLNGRGLHDRQGRPWSAVKVFKMLPRLIEIGPRLLSTEEWPARRERLLQAM